MNFIYGARVPLSEEQFIDAAAARLYDEHARRFMGPIYRRFARHAAGIKIPGNRVLDIGTGSGLLALVLAKENPDWRVTGTDISQEMLNLAQESAARNGLADRVVFQTAPADALPFPDGHFDMVVSNASLHLWKDPLKVFNEIARVTAPGGYCLIRDNLRLAGFSPVLSLMGGAMGMNEDQRRLWMKAIRSSYTPGETRAMLRQSAMRDAWVKTYLSILELGIEWQKL